MNDNLTCLFNWHTTPYHAPIILANHLGFYDDMSLNVALLEPHNPSDVPDIIGSGRIDIGLKAIIHCYAVQGRGYQIQSLGTLLDEPFTGLIYLKSSGIQDFKDLKGKRLGFVGHFGKIIIDDLARRAGFKPDEYDTVRVGMNVVDAIRRNEIDAGIGIGCHHKIELEETCGPAGMLRIDELAGLGCCCFCSIQIIASKLVIERKEEQIERFLFATQRATHYLSENPEQAFSKLCKARPELDNKISQKVFWHTLPFFSKTLENNDRDWKKVCQYAKHLGIIPEDTVYTSIFTNRLLPDRPYAKLEELYST